MPTLRDLSGRLVARLTPGSLRFRLTDVGILQRVAGRTEVDPREPSDEARERSKSRWREASPELGLTWGEALSGGPFVAKLARYAELTDETRLLEIGPGYGRLLSEYLTQRHPFASYLGLDLSERNVAHLTQKFVNPRVRFVRGDAAAAELPSFDLAYSSLTFKHFYPTFEVALANCADAMAPGGRVIFDLLEGKRAYFEHDDQTYVHAYEPDEAQAIVEAAGLRVLTFDHVEHGPSQKRLLVVAGR